VPQHAWVNQYNAKNACNDQKFQNIMQEQKLIFGFGLPQVKQEEN
jgi:hypothetical protein